MRVIFAGTPEFARQALAAIVEAGHEVVLVLTMPDRPSGRGMKLTPSPVKLEAQKHGIPVYQPESLKDPATHAPIKETNAEVMVVAAYGQILPQAVLDIPARGCLNIHASLLPRWRGAAPIQRAIEAGDSETGICIMQMEAGLDTGPVLLEKCLPILGTDTGASLHDKLAALGAQAIVEALARLDELQPITQPEQGITYASKLSKEDARLDWTLPAEVLARKIRAFNPVPGAWTHLPIPSPLVGGCPDAPLPSRERGGGRDGEFAEQAPRPSSGSGMQAGTRPAREGEILKIWQAQVVPGKGRPGEILAVDNGIVVACGEGALKISELQKAGAKRMNAAAFLAGVKIPQGTRLGN